MRKSNPPWLIFWISISKRSGWRSKKILAISQHFLWQNVFLKGFLDIDRWIADAKESLYASLDTETLLQPPPSLLTDIQNIPQSIIKEDLIEEEHQIEDNMTSIPLRKKVCKKLAKVLQKCYLLEKNNAQELTIQIEDKLNRLNNGKENEYKQTIKVLHKLMKVCLHSGSLWKVIISYLGSKAQARWIEQI